MTNFFHNDTLAMFRYLRKLGERGTFIADVRSITILGKYYYIYLRKAANDNKAKRMTVQFFVYDEEGYFLGIVMAHNRKAAREKAIKEFPGEQIGLVRAAPL